MTRGALPEFSHGDKLLMCEHLARMPRVMGIVNSAGPFEPPQRFLREDDTEGFARWIVCCDHCTRLNEPPYWELGYDGKLFIADFHKRHHPAP